MQSPNKTADYPAFGGSAPASYRNRIAANDPVIPQCNSCHRGFFPPRYRCPHCFSADIAAATCATAWIVDASTRVHRPQSDVFFADAPVLLIAATCAGVPLIAEGLGWTHGDAPSVGDPINLIVSRRRDGTLVPMFVPSDNPTSAG